MLNPFSVNWTKLSPGSSAGRFLRFWPNLVPRRMVVRVLGGPNRGFKWVAGSSLNSCWLGTFELDYQKIMLEQVKPGMVVYDLGAHVGFYTLFFSRLVGDSGRVYAIEPLRENVMALMRHLELNGLANVTLLPLAASSERGIVPFQVSTSSSMGRIGEGDGGRMVPAWSLDDLVAKGIPRPDFIKMDVEGEEAWVLAGCPRILTARRTAWFIALHSRKAGDECREIMERNGYLVSVISEATKPSGESFADAIYCRPASKGSP